MSDLSEVTEEQRRKRPKGTSADTRKDKLAKKHGPSKAGGVTLLCGCRYMYSGGAWRHVTPCRVDDLRRLPLDDAEFVTLDAR